MFPPDLTEKAPRIATRKALLVLDLQNDFVKPDGACFVRNAPEFLERVVAVANSFRDAGEPVIWAQSVYDGSRRPVVDPMTGGETVILHDQPPGDNQLGAPEEEYENRETDEGLHGGLLEADKDEGEDGGVHQDPLEADSDPSSPVLTSPSELPPPTFSDDPEAFLSIPDNNNNNNNDDSDQTDSSSCRCCLPKSAGAQFPASILSAIDPDRDTVLTKSDYSAFRSPALLPVLRGAFVSELYLAGSLSNVSVYATVLDAVSQGLAVTLIEDCLGYRSFERHLNAMGYMADVMGADGISADELLLEQDQESPLSRPAAAEDAGIETDLNILNVQSKQKPPPSHPSDGREDDVQMRKARVRPRPGPRGEQRTTTTTSPDDTPVSPSPSPSPSVASPSEPRERSKRPRNSANTVTLGPADRVGEGDSRVVYDLSLPPDAFHLLRQEVNWQKMYHMSGPVPRLVAVQGTVHADGSVPIYRHPADESPGLFPFTRTVDSIRVVVEKLLGHPLNHVLIQLYRDGQDSISEHSDKTLDVARGSYICNVSLGAQRTMTLRTKKSAKKTTTTTTTTDTASSSSETSRQSQRVPLPHNSLFVLGETTNMKWLHGIRPDKRPESTKSRDELAFDGERISLTFRLIATFVNPDTDTIWGQGARSKSKDTAGKIMHGESPETERMIRAFGQENQATEFDWDARYGDGFDVVNFSTTATAKVVQSCNRGQDDVDDLRVRLCLAENGVRYDMVGLDELPSEARASSTATSEPVYLDPDGVYCTSGASSILWHVGHHRRAQDTPDPDMPLDGHSLSTRLRAIDDLLRTVRGNHTNNSTLNTLAPQLSFFESLLRGNKTSPYLAGTSFGIDDASLWPVLRHLVQRRPDRLDGTTYPGLAAYYAKVGRRGCVRNVLGEMTTST